MWTIHKLSEAIKLPYCLKQIVFLFQINRESWCTIEPCPEAASLLASKQSSGRPGHSPALEEIIWCCGLPFRSAVRSGPEERYIGALCSFEFSSRLHQQSLCLLFWFLLIYFRNYQILLICWPFRDNLAMDILQYYLNWEKIALVFYALRDFLSFLNCWLCYKGSIEN